MRTGLFFDNYTKFLASFSLLATYLEKNKECIRRLAEEIVRRPPLCPNCGKRMKSLGKGKGYRCRKCNFKSREATKERILMSRDLKPGLYISPPRVLFDYSAIFSSTFFPLNPFLLLPHPILYHGF